MYGRDSMVYPCYGCVLCKLLFLLLLNEKGGQGGFPLVCMKCTIISCRQYMKLIRSYKTYMNMDIVVPILFVKPCFIFALVLMNQTEKIITVTENCITFVLVGVFLVCKAHSGGIHMFEDVYSIMSVATHLF